MRSGVALLALFNAVAAADLPVPVVAVEPLDATHARFAGVLGAAVRGGGVDYARLRRDAAELDAYRRQLAAAAEPAARDERLAFWINAYNAHTLALVLHLLPADQGAWSAWRLKDAVPAPGPWRTWRVHSAGRWLTLDAIEHEILRPLDESRIHVALNCAARSCPPLAAEPYRAATLDAQLAAATTAFLADATQVRVEGDAVAVNPILEWFAADFRPTPTAWLIAHLPAGDVRAALERGTPLRSGAYDWTLNLPRTP
jgi:hypothetical protein